MNLTKMLEGQRSGVFFVWRSQYSDTPRYTFLLNDVPVTRWRQIMDAVKKGGKKYGFTLVGTGYWLVMDTRITEITSPEYPRGTALVRRVSASVMNLTAMPEKQKRSISENLTAMRREWIPHVVTKLNERLLELN